MTNPTSTHEEMVRRAMAFFRENNDLPRDVNDMAAAFALQVQADAFRRAAEIARGFAHEIHMENADADDIAQAIEQEAQK